MDRRPLTLDLWNSTIRRISIFINCMLEEVYIYREYYRREHLYVMEILISIALRDSKIKNNI